MPLIYITGVEGAGKSTVCESLANQGYDCVDTDAQGLAKRYHQHTWQICESLPIKNTADYRWYNSREWKIKPNDLLSFKKQAETKPVFICGITDNFREIKDFFDNIICLTLPRNMVVHRLTSRSNNNFGKDQGQMEYILQKQKQYEEENYQSGAIMIDASQTLSSVVKEILSKII